MKSQETISQEKAEQFVRMWQTHTGAFVGKQLGLSRQRVHQIANQLRSAGVPLKGKTASNSYSNKLDIEKLKQLALEGG